MRSPSYLSGEGSNTIVSAVPNIVHRLLLLLPALAATLRRWLHEDNGIALRAENSGWKCSRAGLESCLRSSTMRRDEQRAQDVD